MPYHLKTARDDAPRSMLWTVSVLTLSFQIIAFIVNWPNGVLNLLLVAPVCIYAMRAAYANNIKHMTHSSFLLFMLWSWTGLTRLFFVEGVGELLWAPFLIVASTMGVVYVSLSYQRRGLVASGAGSIA